MVLCQYQATSDGVMVLCQYQATSDGVMVLCQYQATSDGVKVALSVPSYQRWGKGCSVSTKLPATR